MNMLRKKKGKLETGERKESRRNLMKKTNIRKGKKNDDKQGNATKKINEKCTKKTKVLMNKIEREEK